MGPAALGEGAGAGIADKFIGGRQSAAFQVEITRAISITYQQSGGGGYGVGPVGLGEGAVVHVFIKSFQVPASQGVPGLAPCSCGYAQPPPDGIDAVRLVETRHC